MDSSQITSLSHETGKKREAHRDWEIIENWIAADQWSTHTTCQILTKHLLCDSFNQSLSHVNTKRTHTHNDSHWECTLYTLWSHNVDLFVLHFRTNRFQTETIRIQMRWKCKLNESQFWTVSFFVWISEFEILSALLNNKKAVVFAKEPLILMWVTRPTPPFS